LLVLGLARGGVAVGYEVARALGARLDAFVVRKLEAPGPGDRPMGVIAAGGVRILDEPWIAREGIPRAIVDEVARREALELGSLERYYRAGRPPPRMTGRSILLVDDGLTAPAIFEGAARALLAYRPARATIGFPTRDGARWEEVFPRKGDLTSVFSPRGDSLGPYEDDEPSDRDIRNLLSQSLHHQGGHRLAG
jgi:predicted phosphoribosyltransferase